MYSEPVIPLLFLGVGTIASAVRQARPAGSAFGTTRQAPDARFTSIEALATSDSAAIARAARGADVLVSFPPDGTSDAELAEHVVQARRVVYLSSSAVYASGLERIDEQTPVAPDGERAQRRLEAEAVWRARGASVLRLPAFYGPNAGLHLSLARGTFRMPGTGRNVVSRVHVDDAARFVLAAFAAPPRSLLLAGDDEPAPVAEVVSFVCELFGLPAPLGSEGDAIPLSLRSSRCIDSSETRRAHGIELAYPGYREGYRAVHTLLASS